MIEKKDDNVSLNSDIDEPVTFDDDPTSPASVLAESCQSLEIAMLQVQDDITKSFARFMETLRSREKQLLRQVDVLHSQQLALLQSNQTPDVESRIGMGSTIPQVLVNLEGESDLIENILSFGKVSLESGSLVAIEGSTSPYSIPYKSEDYQDADHDHVCLYKPLSVESTPQHHIIKFGFAPKLSSTLSDSPRSESNEESNNEIDSNESTEPKSEDNSETDKPNVSERRPSQVQHWLQQIMVETETEPSVGELQKNFEEMSPTNLAD